MSYERLRDLCEDLGEKELRDLKTIVDARVENLGVGSEEDLEDEEAEASEESTE